MAKTKSKPPTEIQQHRITVAERKKAEELIRAKFTALEKAVDSEVKLKLAELQEAWAREKGVKKLVAKIAHHEKAAEELREQLIAVAGNRWYDGSTDKDVEMCGPYGEVKQRLLTAKHSAQSELADRRNEVIKQLWFSLLSDDARQLLDSIPTVAQLKSNGLAMLAQPVKKLLKA